MTSILLLYLFILLIIGSNKFKERVKKVKLCVNPFAFVCTCSYKALSV